jgi:hypothetical protein
VPTQAIGHNPAYLNRWPVGADAFEDPGELSARTANAASTPAAAIIAMSLSLRAAPCDRSNGLWSKATALMEPLSLMTFC